MTEEEGLLRGAPLAAASCRTDVKVVTLVPELLLASFSFLLPPVTTGPLSSLWVLCCFLPGSLVGVFALFADRARLLRLADIVFWRSFK
jgi:hypothetical protein